MSPEVVRTGTLPDNLTAFGRALRRAGVLVDASRIALATEAVLLLGLQRKEDVEAALEACLVSRAQDRTVFRELFLAFFREPDDGLPLAGINPPQAEDRAPAPERRSRTRDALAPQRHSAGVDMPRPQDAPDAPAIADASMTASHQQRLRQADFQTLSADEYRWVERLARDITLPVPEHAERRTRLGTRGHALHWAAAMQRSLRTGGEWFDLPRRERRRQPAPLLVLVDVSGSMERYARLLLGYLHSATRQVRRRDVFALGTHLTDLTPAFRQPDTDQMLLKAGERIPDFAGGTRLGECLTTLRRQHGRRLVGRRSLVLLVSDGLDTGEPAVLRSELQWLKLHTGRLVWLNPLLRFAGYAPLARGASVLYQAADAMLAVHNLNRLEDLAASVAQVVRSARRPSAPVQGFHF